MEIRFSINGTRCRRVSAANFRSALRPNSFCVFVPFAGMRDYEYDLLRATSKSEQNYVAFGAETDAITRTPSTNLPSTLTEMAIVASVRTPFSGGYLFSIVKPLDSVISLGVSMYPLRRNTYNISLIYTNTNLFVKSQNVATFQFTYARSIIDVALKVSGHQITLFVGCYELKTIPRDPVDTIIDRDSKFYVASAGAKQKNGFKARMDDTMAHQISFMLID